MKFKFLVYFIIIVSHSALSQSTVGTNPSKKFYNIGFYASPPLSFPNAQGKPEGLIVDLLNEISKQEGFEINWRFDDWSHFIEQIKTNDLDMITSVGFTQERAKFMDYSQENFITVWGQVFLPSNSDVESIVDLNNKTIGILKDGVNGKRFISQCEQFEINCNIQYLGSYEEIFKKIAKGEIDAGVSNNLVGSTFLNEYDMISSAIVFNPFKVYVGVPKDQNQALIKSFDKYLNQWKKDKNSYYYSTRLKWLHPDPQLNIPAIILYLILALMFLSVTAVLFAFFFKRQVNKRVQELNKRELQLNQIINLVPHMIFVSDAQGNVVLANKTASHYFGMSVKEFESCNVNELSDQYNRFKKLIVDKSKNPNKKNKINKEIHSRDFYGDNHSLYLSKTPFIGSTNHTEATVTVAVDITDVKKFEEKIKFMDQHDALTQLPNRLLLNDRINHSLVLSKRNKNNGCILFIGLDHFKSINDSQGHKVGDLLIIEVAKRLQEYVPTGDTIARLGGDEFIVELSELKSDKSQAQEDANYIAQVILDLLSKPYHINNEVFHITASIGAVLYPKDGKTQGELIQRADTALHMAKKKGRNRIQFFESEFEYSVINKHNIEKDLRQALKKHEFFMMYQPVVDGNSHRIVGSEALIRWNHPKKGTIYPIDFIQIAEKKNLIVDIGDWVFEQVCIKIQENIMAGEKDFFIAVNVSVMQIKDKQFYQKVADLIRQYKIPANYLEIEVTESVLMEETERTTSILKKLKLLGIKISIDDFGTGYSSFNYLMNFPIDKIKIDQSFVKNLPLDTNSITIVTTILRMAKEMGMSVVAEGVETQQQFDFLQSKACQYYQGYFFHKPLCYRDLAKITAI